MNGSLATLIYSGGYIGWISLLLSLPYCPIKSVSDCRPFLLLFIEFLLSPFLTLSHIILWLVNTQFFREHRTVSLRRGVEIQREDPHRPKYHEHTPKDIPTAFFQTNKRIFSIIVQKKAVRKEIWHLQNGHDLMSGVVSNGEIEKLKIKSELSKPQNSRLDNGRVSFPNQGNKLESLPDRP